MKKLLLWITLLSLPMALSMKLQAMTVQDIAAVLKQSLHKVEVQDFHRLMKKHVVQMRLMNVEGQWVNERFANASDKIIPTQTTMLDINNFVDEMVSVNQQNAYLTDFLSNIDDDYPQLQEKFKQEGHAIFPDVLAYAYVLNNMTKVMANDWRLIESMYLTWKTVRKDTALLDNVGLFEKIKVYSVEGPIKKIIKFHKEDELQKKYLKAMLPINIYQAVIFDYYLGNLANAKSGLILAKYNPAGKEAEGVIDNLYAQWSTSSQAIVLGIPNAEQWADLYGLWNLAFVSHYPNFPYVMAKLVIPQQANHYGKSGEYIYNRAISLYIHAHFSLLGRLDGERYLANGMDWFTEDLYMDMGKASLRSAKSYKKHTESLRLDEIKTVSSVH